jgi:hypothetical protein
MPAARRKPAARRSAIRRTERIGMGNLISLKIVLATTGRTVTWHFKEHPVLSFDVVSEDASGKGRQSRLFVDCGNYLITADGKCVVAKAPAKRTVAKATAKSMHDYSRTHGGLDPSEILVCSVRVAGRTRFVGRCTQMDYRADKKTHGRVQYYHPLERHAQPEVWVNEDGNQIYFRKGKYTVTPHGIEDEDR